MRKIRNFLFFILFAGILVVMGTYLLQEKFIFLPTTLDRDYQYTFDQDFEELFIETSDGASLNALHFKLEKPRGIIVYYHGNAGDLSRWGNITSYFTEHNYEVLVMDYRTYGKSTGKLSEEALYSDASLFYEKAKQLFPENQIIVYGRSLGSAMASYVASKNKPKKLILETPFYDLRRLVKKKVSYFPAISGLLKYKFPTAEFVNDVTCPITIIHGTKDGVVPFESAELLYSTIDPAQRKLVVVPEGKHNNLITFPHYTLAIQKELF